jgi:NAD(P)H-hydrate epimerase
MRPVLTAEAMRRVDARATAELGIAGPILMENAGRGAADALLAALPERGLRPRGLKVSIACGGGGNGGDGFVVARRLKRAGARPDVLLVVPPDRLRGDAAVKFAEMRRAGIAARVVEDAATVTAALGRADVIVDALLGTGARGAPMPLVAALIEAMNASGRPVVAEVMWMRRTSSNGTASTSPHGGFAAWFSLSSSFVVNGRRRRSSSVLTGRTPSSLRR